MNPDNSFHFPYVIEDLGSKKRHSEAARVLLDYAKDIREAVIALAQGNHFSEARRIVRSIILLSSGSWRNVFVGNYHWKAGVFGRYYSSSSARKLRADHGRCERV